MKITIIILVIVALGAAIAFFLLGRKKQEGKKAYKPGNSVFSQKNIIWIVGYRTDDRYKVDTQKTKHYYKIIHKSCE